MTPIGLTEFASNSVSGTIFRGAVSVQMAAGACVLELGLKGGGKVQTEALREVMLVVAYQAKWGV